MSFIRERVYIEFLDSLSYTFSVKYRIFDNETFASTICHSGLFANSFIIK